MDKLVRYVSPSLAAVLLFISGVDFVPPPSQFALGWKAIGLLFPALWLTSIGPQGLMQGGGFLMRLFRAVPSRQTVALFGLVWLAVFFLSAFILSRPWLESAIVQCFLYAIAHCGLMASLGVYVFLAAEQRDRRSPRESSVVVTDKEEEPKL